MVKVAIVEDTHEIRNGLKLILDGTEGFTCEAVFSNAEEAKAGLLKSNPDVVLMDIGLPGMSGIDFVRIVKEARPEILIMMFTVFDDDQKIFDALKAGANGYILKKTPPARILEAIQELADGGSPMSISIARKVVSFFQLKTAKEPEHMLTNRELEILGLLSNGFLYKEIATNLHIATGTVKRHIHQIYEKLHVQNKTEAINKVFPKSTSQVPQLPAKD